MVRQDSDFEASMQEFRKLLRKSNYAENVVWLTPEDVPLTNSSRCMFVKVPVSPVNEAEARRTYDAGIAHGRGLLLRTVCEMDDTTFCGIWYPKNSEEEPQGIWPKNGGVKMSVTMGESRMSAKCVRSRLLWALLRIRYRSRQSLRPWLFQ